MKQVTICCLKRSIGVYPLDQGYMTTVIAIQVILYPYKPLYLFKSSVFVGNICTLFTKLVETEACS